MVSNPPLSLTDQLVGLLDKLLPMVGVLVGALLQNRLSKSSQARERRHTLRAQAYVDFLRSCAQVAIAQASSDTSKEVEGLAIMMDAKARISVYGDSAVVGSLAQFLRGGAVLDNPQSMKAFADLIQVMRRESLGPGQQAIDDDVIRILFGRGISNT